MRAERSGPRSAAGGSDGRSRSQVPVAARPPDRAPPETVSLAGRGPSGGGCCFDAAKNSASTTMPMTRITIIDAISAGVSLSRGRSASAHRSTGWLAMITSSSPAIRLRHANAQPCFMPADERRQRGGQDDVAVQREAPRAEHAAGPQQYAAGSLSMPLISPLAIDGAAPSTTTNMIAASRQLEQQDREREPRDRRHGLQAGDERAERGAQRSRDCATRRRRRRRR